MRRLLLPFGVIALTCGLTPSPGGAEETSIASGRVSAAAAGDLDTTFGSGNGAVVTDLGVGTEDAARAVAIQDDGKIVLAGLVVDGSARDIAVVRYNTNGSLDTTFGGGDGIVTTDIGASDDEAQALAVQPDGKIVVAGLTNNGSDNDVAVLRYHSDGSLDTTFGGGDGIATADLGGNETVSAVAIQSDGMVVVAGGSYSVLEDIMVLRFRTDGSLDPAFGSSGIVLTDVNHTDDVATSIFIQKDGNIVVAGSTTSGGNPDIVVARYHSDGLLDTSFGGGDGIVTTDTGGETGSWSSALQADGKILVAGPTLNGTHEDIAVLRYHPDGSVDTTFGVAGMVTTDIDAGSREVSVALAIQRDGKIVVAASSALGFEIAAALVRYNTDGSLDTTFGGDGKVRSAVTFPGQDMIHAITIQADGRIVVAGHSRTGSDWDFIAMRFDAGSGYWLVDASGLVYEFGDAADFSVPALPAGRTAVDIESTPTGAGLWVLDSDGAFYPYGDAAALAALDMSALDELVDFANAPDVPEQVVSMVPTASGLGMFVFTNKGRVITRGDAATAGDVSALRLSSPVLDAKLDPDGSGYWMLAADGGVFSFDAEFHGSVPQLVPEGLTTEQWLNEPIVGMTPDPASGGYWLIAADGGVFSFGGAAFRGSMGGIPLNKPVVGAVSYGNGYLMVAEDGGVFNFSNKPFEGSLGGNPPTTPVVTITPIPAG